MSCPHVGKINKPTSNHDIHKDQCTLCFGDPFSEGGLDVCLTCFNGSCGEHSAKHRAISKHAIVLNLVKVDIPPEPKNDDDENAEPVLTKVAIGVEGGLDVVERKFETVVKVYCHDCDCELKLDEYSELNEIVAEVERLDSATKDKAAPWELKLEPCIHTGSLVQQEKDLASKTLAQCSECELTENLWLCMTCGNLGCGRKNFDGSGGNGHAAAHGQSTSHPLVIQTGTITPDGEASAYCYTCDNDVKDENLGRHLATFGIAMEDQVKTEKSILEKTLDLNEKFKWASVLEDGKEAELCFGPGYGGFENIGNSCYMNSVLHSTLSLPAFKERYYTQGKDHMNECKQYRPANCFMCQMTKVAVAIFDAPHSTKPSQVEKEAGCRQPRNCADPNDPSTCFLPLQPGVAPRLFKKMIAQDHKEFSSNQQQDALEYLQHFCSEISKKELKSGNNNDVSPATCFDFIMETRDQCTACHKVKYRAQPASSITLPLIKVEKEPEEQDQIQNNQDDNNDDDDDTINISNAGPKKKSTNDKASKYEDCDFKACLAQWSQSETIHLRCDCGGSQFTRTTRFKTFPDVLVVSMRRFDFDNWIPTKLMMKVNNAEQIDLDQIRCTAVRQDDEELFPVEEKAAGPQPDQAIVNALLAMGIPELHAQKAALAVNNSSDAQAISWYFEHNNDPDINDPIPTGGSGGSNSGGVPPEAASLVAMGFPENKIIYALKQCGNNADAAMNWLFNNPDDPCIEAAPAIDPNTVDPDQGKAEYKLVSAITHLGQQTKRGHYVCHVRRDNSWILFNDAKVSKPTRDNPTGHAYMYFYQRQSK